MPLDASRKEALIDRFAAWLDSRGDDDLSTPLEEPQAADEEADLYAVFVELAGLRSEVRTESRLVKEALDQFRGVFDTLRASQATLEQELKRARAETQERERALLRPLLLDVIDLRDRLAAGLKPAAAPEGWSARLRRALTRPPDDTWREGLGITLRRLDKLLADRRVVAIESLGRPFDPRLAVAVATRNDPDLADGRVVEELRPGFLWHDDVLRPAEVVVARRAARNGETP
jgi:molecular chaperone GrpE